MTKPDKQRDKAIDRLGEELNAFEAKRARPNSFSSESGISEGYRLLAGLLSGVLGGLGLGWVIDHFAHTSPFGLIGGLLIGTVGGIYSTVRAASVASVRAGAKSGPAPSVPDVEDGEQDRVG